MALRVYRIGLATMTVMVLFQAVMAGRVLDGSGGALALHESGAHTLLFTSLLVAIIAAVAWRRRQLAGWHAAISGVALPVVVYVQLHVGYARELQLHVPLGVTLLGATLVLLWASTTASARRKPVVGSATRAGRQPQAPLRG